MNIVLYSMEQHDGEIGQLLATQPHLRALFAALVRERAVI